MSTVQNTGITLLPSGQIVFSILKLLPVLFNALHSGLLPSAEDRVSFTGDRGGQAKKGDTPPKIFVRRGN